MKRNILIAIIALIFTSGSIGYYIYNRPQKDMQAAKADIAIDAGQLFSEFEADETAANAKYLDKTIAVTGKVKSTEASDDGAVKVALDTGKEFGVFCELDPLSKHPRTTFTAGETVVFKGLCTGLNFDVQLTRCVEVK